MSHDTAQETLVEVTGIVRRLVPCPEHEQDPPGVQLERRNPNGYHHDCAACAAMTPTLEPLEA